MFPRENFKEPFCKQGFKRYDIEENKPSFRTRFAGKLSHAYNNQDTEHDNNKLVALKLVTCILLLCFIGCHSIESLSHVPKYAAVIKSELTLTCECLLYPREERLFEKDIEFDLYVIDKNNSWRKEGRVPKGTPIRIFEINKYKTNEAGYWIGATGNISVQGTEKSFIYHIEWVGIKDSPPPWQLTTN